MEWRYKTVHYAVKKDGFLGGSFLDEEEMESSLNNYGEQGWELVSLLEVRDGVVAVFKQEKDLFKGGCLAEIVPEQEEPLVVSSQTVSQGQEETCDNGQEIVFETETDVEQDLVPLAPRAREEKKDNEVEDVLVDIRIE